MFNHTIFAKQIDFMAISFPENEGNSTQTIYVSNIENINVIWLNKKGYHQVVSQTEKEFVYKNSIHFALLVHCQEYRTELGFYVQTLSQFVNPPSDTIHRYFNMFHLAPSP
jgi:hypothetical protein